LSKRLQRHYPPHRVYVDVFGGSGALIARQEPRAEEVYNDLDTDVYNVFATVKEPAGHNEVLRLLETTSNDREQYTECKQILADTNESSIRRAWAFMVAGTIGFSAHPALANGWTRSEIQRRDLRNLPAKMQWWHDRLRNVHLENRPWQEVIDIYDSPASFFLLDPPYLAQVLRSEGNQYYQHRMAADAHVELIERLRTIKGCALICGYNHPLYTALLFYWRKVCFCARETMGGRAGKRQEVVWLNYEDDGSRIETNRLRITKRFIDIMQGEEQAFEYLERVRRLRQLPQ
jgi:DNA adenine methylase